ncbi:S66 family peptidase [Lederbergia galactosidilytica]|uniref:Peptidase S66 n=1 Tax=Lederbergia galactosidilytica TaxID=217031 RepID=A0A0Q9XST4_9BACI|nr:S66 peptidase family protein [Lederbergia galactosidilytica]KRG11500.1 peptidase S66 [Lederbergia galactosidilytica]KRG14496.1 peptidase S66 [Virgibacillus soli]OAK68242.1 peptidase S66 [Lederbergia galactosidilytica]
MIRYPFLRNKAKIGVTAPSSGVRAELHPIVKQACQRLGQRGFTVKCGATVWTQNKAKSASAKDRATEFQQMLRDESVDLLIPPWGGELLIEVLEYIDFEQLPNKWILGYSDISLLLLAITLTSGMATAHGTNLLDLRGEYSDETTAMWEKMLATRAGESVVQHSSLKYQKEWQHDRPSSCVYHLTEQTIWKTIAHSPNVTIKGRLLGGCIDVIRHLIGTPYGDVQRFKEQFLADDPLIWYLENCELSTVDLRRSLVQMKLAGWFEGSAGILFGRSSANQAVQNYTVEDVYQELAKELNIPIIYDVDCGHVPPQITFINGAFAEVKVGNGQGTIRQCFIP